MNLNSAVRNWTGLKDKTEPNYNICLPIKIPCPVNKHYKTEAYEVHTSVQS